MSLVQQFKAWRADREFSRLLAQLKSSDVIARNMAVQALERLGDKRAIQPLVGELQVSGVNHAAAKALVALGWRPEEPSDAALFHAVYWSGDRFDAGEVRRLADEGHGRLVAEALAREVIHCSNDYCSERAARLIGELGVATDDVLRSLIAYIWLGNTGDERVQIACADTLARIGDQRVVTDLERAPVRQPWPRTEAAVRRAVGALRERIADAERGGKRPEERQHTDPAG